MLITKNNTWKDSVCFNSTSCYLMIVMTIYRNLYIQKDLWRKQRTEKIPFFYKDFLLHSLLWDSLPLYLLTEISDHSQSLHWNSSPHSQSLFIQVLIPPLFQWGISLSSLNLLTTISLSSQKSPTILNFLSWNTSIPFLFKKSSSILSLSLHWGS